MTESWYLCAARKSLPNRTAATICRLLIAERLTLKVHGLGALDGSPVLDIKLVFAEFLPDKSWIRQPGWSHQIMEQYFISRRPDEA